MSEVMALIGFLGLLALLIPKLRVQHSQVVQPDVNATSDSRTSVRK